MNDKYNDTLQTTPSLGLDINKQNRKWKKQVLVKVRNFSMKYLEY